MKSEKRIPEPKIPVASIGELSTNTPDDATKMEEEVILVKQSTEEVAISSTERSVEEEIPAAQSTALLEEGQFYRKRG